MNLNLTIIGLRWKFYTQMVFSNSVDTQDPGQVYDGDHEG